MITSIGGLLLINPRRSEYLDGLRGIIGCCAAFDITIACDSRIQKCVACHPMMSMSLKLLLGKPHSPATNASTSKSFLEITRVI
jgi:hypothetical protein